LPERQPLFSLIEHYVPRFSNLTKKKNLDLILRGLNIDNPDVINLNTTLTKTLQNFILQIKIFTPNKTPD
jgi:hypothetical protein